MYPFSEAILTDGNCCVVRCREHLCGYVQLAHEAIPAEWWGSYDAPGLQFLAIHGGPTYAKDTPEGAIFGFDCAHAGDADNDRLQIPEYVMELTYQMRDQLLALAARHAEFSCVNRAGKAAIIDEITATATLTAEMGLGGMIQLLCGAPSLGED